MSNVDDDSPYPAARENEKGAKISYVPRRLVIGKDEYVQTSMVNDVLIWLLIWLHLEQANC